MTVKEFIGQRYFKIFFIFFTAYTFFFIFSFAVLGIHYGEAGKNANFWLNGSLLGVPFTQFNMKDGFLHSDFVGWLFRNFPGVSWLALYFTINTFISILITGAVMVFLLKHKISLLVLVPVILLLHLNILTLDSTRTAFSLSLTGISLFFLQLKTESFRKRLLLFVAALLFFTAGTFMRSEAAIGTLLTALPVLLFSGRKNWSRFGITALPFVILVAGYSAVFLYKLSFSTSFYYQIEPDFEYELMDKQNFVPMSRMKTKKDSLRYEAVIGNWMLADSVQTPPQFIRSLIAKQSGFWDRFILFPKSFDIDTFLFQLKKVTSDSAFVLLITLLLLLALIINREPLFLLTALCVTGYALFLVVVVIGGINSELNERFYEPIFAIAGCVLLTLASRFQPQKISVSMYCAAVAILFAGSIYAWHVSKSRSSSVESQIHANKLFLHQVNALPGYDYVFNTSDDGSIYQTDVWDSRLLFGSKKVVPVDFVQYSYSSQVKNRLKEITGCPDYDFPCRFEFLIKNKEKTLIVGSEQRLAFYQYYLDKMYGVSLNYTPLPIEHANGKDRVFVFR